MRDFLSRVVTYGLLAAAVVVAVALFVDREPPHVPDRPAVPLQETAPAPWTPPGGATPEASVSDGPASTVDGTPADVPSTVDVVPVEQAQRPPLEFETHTPAAEVDYRDGRIMEPLVDDGQERERAYARCRGGWDAVPDADQAAYCERYYGPDSGYQPGD